MAETKKKSASKAKTKKTEELEVVVAETPAEVQAETAQAVESVKASPRSKRYMHYRSMVDRTHFYPIKDAVAMVKKTHYGKMGGSLEVHLMLKDEGMSVDVTFPFSTGKKRTIAVVTDELMAEIEKGVINFDVLVAHPSQMPKLAKLARVLGPKGLMPNPKSGTVSADPEKRKKELEAGTISIKGERKAPLAHVIVGKLNQADDELAANTLALIKAVPPGKVLKCVIAGSMSPGVKVQL